MLCALAVKEFLGEVGRRKMKTNPLSFALYLSAAFFVGLGAAELLMMCGHWKAQTLFCLLGLIAFTAGGAFDWLMQKGERDE